MIQVKNLSFAYPESQSSFALRGVSFTLNPGEHVAMMGANGSGKSTLAKCLNGILLPQSGQVHVDDFLTSEESHQYEIRKKVGMVFQNPDNQFVTTSVFRELIFGLENIGLSKQEMEKRVEDAIQVFQLDRFRETPPHLLSGGEKQRVVMAAVWVMHPDYFILDEPTSLLDPQNRRDLIKMITNSPHMKDKGILFITQFSDETLPFDRLLIMHQGQRVMDGMPTEIFQKSGRLQKMGLDIPVEVELSQYLEKLHAHTD